MSDPTRRPLRTVVSFEHKTVQKIEDWRARQKGKPTLSDAIQRLVEMSLADTHSAPRSNKRAAAQGSELAGEAIDRLSDSSATVEEQATRKRRLLKGPAEFREMRDDLRGPKD